MKGSVLSVHVVGGGGGGSPSSSLSANGGDHLVRATCLRLSPCHGYPSILGRLLKAKEEAWTRRDITSDHVRATVSRALCGVGRHSAVTRLADIHSSQRMYIVTSCSDYLFHCNTNGHQERSRAWFSSANSYFLTKDVCVCITTCLYVIVNVVLTLF